MEMNSPGIQVKLHSSHCGNYNKTEMIFFLRGRGELSVHWHWAAGYWILGVLFKSITRLPDGEQTWWGSESGGALSASCVPRESFICIWWAAGKRIKAVCNPAVERQATRRFLQLEGMIHCFCCGRFARKCSIFRDSVTLQLCANSNTLKIHWRMWPMKVVPSNEDRTNSAFRCSSSTHNVRHFQEFALQWLK